jgi:hypothetical protein
MPHYKAGQALIAKINGIPQEVKVRAVLDTTEGVKLIVDFGHEQVATYPHPVPIPWYEVLGRTLAVRRHP